MTVGDRIVPLTDAGNAELFAHEHGADLRWVPDWVTWVRYDGTRWARTRAGAVVGSSASDSRISKSTPSDDLMEEVRPMPRVDAGLVLLWIRPSA